MVAPLAIAGIASSIFSAARQARQMRENQEAIAKLQGATPEMIAGQENLQFIADQLASGQGVTDIAFNRATRAIQENAAQQVAQTFQTVRDTLFASPLVIDQIAEQALVQSRKMIEEGQEKLTSIDVEAALSNLKTAASVQSQAAQQANVIKQFEDRMFEQQMKLESDNAKLFSDTMSKLGSALGTFLNESGTFQDEDPFADEPTQVDVEEDEITPEDEAIVAENQRLGDLDARSEEFLQLAEEARERGDLDLFRDYKRLARTFAVGTEDNKSTLQKQFMEF